MVAVLSIVRVLGYASLVVGFGLACVFASLMMLGGAS